SDSIFIIPPPLPLTLFPYTTLFRSSSTNTFIVLDFTSSFTTSMRFKSWLLRAKKTSSSFPNQIEKRMSSGLKLVVEGLFHIDNRSEEHTSELQSRENLVCRLLLEKK